MDEKDDKVTTTTDSLFNVTERYYDYTVPMQLDYDYPYDQLDLSPSEIERANRIYKSFNALFRSSSDML